jgi:hypothetical protein
VRPDDLHDRRAVEGWLNISVSIVAEVMMIFSSGRL